MRMKPAFVTTLSFVSPHQPSPPSWPLAAGQRAGALSARNSGGQARVCSARRIGPKYRVRARVDPRRSAPGRRRRCVRIDRPGAAQRAATPAPRRAVTAAPTPTADPAPRAARAVDHDRAAPPRAGQRRVHRRAPAPRGAGAEPTTAGPRGFAASTCARWPALRGGLAHARGGVGARRLRWRAGPTYVVRLGRARRRRQPRARLGRRDGSGCRSARRGSSRSWASRGGARS